MSSYQPTSSSSWRADGHVTTVDAHPAIARAASEDAALRWRWIAMGVFLLSASLNYLDRQLLAAVAPSLMAEFRMSNADYGTLLAAFSMTYMVMAPLAGLFVDRVGLHAGAMIAVGAWSLVGAATGLTSTYRGLVACRMGLGVAEAAGIPCSSKASAMYLQPRELGLGIAVGSFGITLGIVSAPLIVAAIAPAYGWRAAFVVCGAAGLLWVPLWWFTSRRIPPRAATTPAVRSATVRHVLRDVRLWGILAANVLFMAVHSLWMNWTTIYFVQVHHLTQTDANRYFAWIPPIFATLGGLFGAWLVMRRVDAGSEPLKARLRMCWTFPPLLLVTALVPLMESPALAAAGISLSFFSIMMILTNLHVIPIDLFGAERAAFTSALLAASYALMQMVLSPAMGVMADRFGFGALCVVVSMTPLAAAAILRATVGVDGSRRAAA